MSGRPIDQEKLNNTLEKVCEILNKHNIHDWFISFGTLLGIIRENSRIESQMLPHITITNCDNYYVPIWVSEINNLINQDKDFIYWDCVHDHKNSNSDRTCGYGLLNSQLKLCWIDMGCVAVKSNIATKVGFPFKDFAADWEFFKACLKHISPDKIQKISKILFVHN
jgi:hypothetical protein